MDSRCAAASCDQDIPEIELVSLSVAVHQKQNETHFVSGSCLESDDGEDDDSGEHRSPAVGERNEQRISEAVVVGGVVGAERDEATERQS